MRRRRCYSMSRSVLVVSRILLVVVLAAVTYFSLTPSPPSGPDVSDKVMHLSAYIALAFLLVLSFQSRRFGLAQVIMLLAAIIAYGAAIEFVQRLTGRQFEVADMATNAVGAIVGAAIGMVARRIIERRGKAD